MEDKKIYVINNEIVSLIRDHIKQWWYVAFRDKVEHRITYYRCVSLVCRKDVVELFGWEEL